MGNDTKTLKVVIVGNSKSGQKALRDLGVAGDRAEKKTRSMGSKIGASMLAVGKRTALGVGVAAGAAGAFVYKVGAPYEQSLNKIKALNNANSTEMRNAVGVLEKNTGLYSSMGMTVGDAANGVVELSKSGMSLDKSLKAVNATMILAKGGGMDVAESAALVSNSMNVWKMKADKAADVSNVLANAANISSADVKDLSLSLSMSSNVAAKMGLSFEETNGILAQLANAGMKGSDAGTSLKTMLTSLGAPTGAARTWLEKMGVSIYDATGNMKPMRDIIGELAPALGRLSEEEQNYAKKAIFGQDAVRAANVLLGNGVKAYDDNTKAVQKAGAAQKMAQANSKGLSGTVNRLKAGFVSMGQIAFRAAAPILNGLLKPLAKGLESLIPKVEPVAKAIAGAFGGNSVGGIKRFGGAFATVKKFITDILPTVKAVAQKFMDALKPALDDIGDILVQQVIPAFKKFLPIVTPVVKFLINVVGGALIGAFKGVVNVVKGVLKIISGIMNVITGIFTGDFARVWQGLKQIVGGALQAVWGVIQVWWYGSILGIFRKGLTALKGLVQKGWQGLKGLFTSGVNALKGAMGGVGRAISAPFRAAWGAVRGAVSAGWNFVRGLFTRGIGQIRAVLGVVRQFLPAAFRAGMNAARNAISAAWNAVRSRFTGGVNTVKAIVRNVPTFIKNQFKSAGSWLVDAGKNVIRGLVKGLDAARGWITDKVQELVNLVPKKIRSFFGIASPAKKMIPLGQFITEGIANGLANSKSKKKIDKALAQVKAGITRVFNKGEINKGQRDNLMEQVEKRGRKMLKAVKNQAGLMERIEKAQEAVEAARERVNELMAEKGEKASSVAESVRGGIMDVLGNGDDEPNTVRAILDRFRLKIAAMNNFRGNLERLRQLGFSAATVNQIAEAGAESGGIMAAALARATPGDVSEFNSLDATGAWASTEIGNGVANSLYDGQIAAARQNLATVQNTTQNYNITVQGNVTSENNLAKNIAKKVRDEIDRDNKRNGRKR